MIQLKQNELLFQFPSVAEELHALAAEEVDANLDGILKEDREALIRSRLDEMPWMRKREKQRAIDQFLGMPEEKIREAFAWTLNRLAPREIETMVRFNRGLRFPDDGQIHCFSIHERRAATLRRVDDCGANVPPEWQERGGVMTPLYLAEALELGFGGFYPVALKIRAGKINAVSGEMWREGLHRTPQDFIVVPGHIGLSGFSVDKGVFRQCVVAPLEQGWNRQISGGVDHGEILIEAYPMRPEVHYRDNVKGKLPSTLSQLLYRFLPLVFRPDGQVPEIPDYRSDEPPSEEQVCLSANLGRGMGGQVRRMISQDRRGLDSWQPVGAACFVHVCNALEWREITGENPPHAPFTVKEYEKAELPWFDRYQDDLAVLEGAKTLPGFKGTGKARRTTGKRSAHHPGVVPRGPEMPPDQVREWTG